MNDFFFIWIENKVPFSRASDFGFTGKSTNFQIVDVIVDITAYIVIRNGKLDLKHGQYYRQFCLNLKFLRWPYREYIKTVKNACFQ